ncbi:major facilitator superfamily domain-containing protein [Chaetomium sp. MPI-SDFR-AT-0129]|nr:major facilitator superfamily domain-containing protein [Chaetomium sp. MPI-SDFR-AT-0129]
MTTPVQVDQPIRLSARHAGAERSGPSAFDPPSTTPPATLPPISRKKQAAVLLSAFTTIALTIGYNQCYGVFQEYYLSPRQDVLVPSPALQPTSPPPTALLAFVGTLCYGLTWAGGILVNPVIARIEHGIWAPTTPTSRLWRRRVLRSLTARTITVSGVLVTSLGFLLASFSRSIWQLLLTQGLLILAGGGAGGLILSPVIRALLSSVGGRWTLRIYAIFSLVAGLPVAWAVPRSRFATGANANQPSTPHSEEPGEQQQQQQQPEESGRPNTHVSRALASRPTFLLSAVAAFLQAAGAQLPLSFIPSYTVTLGMSASTGADLLAASSAVNAASRILTGYAGDRLGRQNTLVLTLLLAACSVFALWLSSAAAASSSLWLAFIALYSFSAGGYYALFPALVADVFGIRQYAAVNAFILFVRGLGTMFGSPVGGQLLGDSHEGARAYASIAYWDGALLMCATVCCVGVRWADAKGKGWKWIA